MKFVSDTLTDEMRSQYEVLFRYLRSKSPDEWYRIAESWNSDNPLDLLIWIAELPSCDKSTAQLMFHKTCAADMLELAASRTSTYVSEIALCKTIAQRWNAGFYTRSELASLEDYDSFMTRDDYRNTEDNIPKEQLPWTVDDTMFDKLDGRVLSPFSWANYNAGYPPNVVAGLKAMGLWS